MASQRCSQTREDLNFHVDRTEAHAVFDAVKHQDQEDLPACEPSAVHGRDVRTRSGRSFTIQQTDSDSTVQEMDLTYSDAKKLSSLLWNQENLVEKKRRWLQSLIPESDGCQRSSKRPKFLINMYLAESDVRSDEVSCENVRANVERSFGWQCDTIYKHHVVQDCFQLFDMQKVEDRSIRAESLMPLYSIIRKLSNTALQAVASIVTYNSFIFKKTRPTMKKIIISHLPNYLANLNRENSLHQLSQIFRNPCSFRSDTLKLVTPVSPALVSSINNTLDRLDEMSLQELVAMNRKLRGKSCAPKFPLEFRACKRDLLIERVRKKCSKIISKLTEGNDLPTNLAKALSVMRLSLRHKLKCKDISQSEFFPFSKKTIYLQNDILRALWSLSKVKHEELKLLQPILDPDSKIPWVSFRISLRKYLEEYLFVCGEVNLSDEANQAIAFINRRSRREQFMLSEEAKEEEVGAVLNLSSHLKAVTCSWLLDHNAQEYSSDESSLGSDDCSEDNDFVLSETNYFFSPIGHEYQQESCSNNICSVAEVSEGCSSDVTETIGGSHSVATNMDFHPESKEFLANTPQRTESSREVGDHEASKEVNGNNVMNPNFEKVNDVRPMKTGGCSEVELHEICDGVATMTHRLIGHMLDKFLLVENREIDEWTGSYLGDGSVFPRDAEGLLGVSKENPKACILVHAVENLLPSLPKSCIDRVKRLMELS